MFDMKCSRFLKKILVVFHPFLEWLWHIWLSSFFSNGKTCTHFSCRLSAGADVGTIEKAIDWVSWSQVTCWWHLVIHSPKQIIYVYILFTSFPKIEDTKTNETPVLTSLTLISCRPAFEFPVIWSCWIKQWYCKDLGKWHNFCWRCRAAHPHGSICR